VDNEFKRDISGTSELFRDCMNELRFNVALEKVWNAILKSNRYIDKSAPWKLRGDPAKADRFATVIYNLCESLRILSILVCPVIPNTASAIREQLGLSGEVQPGSFERAGTFGLLNPGKKIGEVKPIFPKKE
jgi:methionyl-tRNA synthetase